MPALTHALTDEALRLRAKSIAERIAGEDGLGSAVRAFERIVSRGQEDGEFRSDGDPRLASFVFYGALEEILTGWVLGTLEDGDEQIAAAEQTVVEIVCGGLTPATAPAPA